MRIGRLMVVGVLLCAVGGAGPAWGYVDIQPTLGRIVSEARWVFVVRVERVSREKRAIIYGHVEDLKGNWAAAGKVRHLLSDGDPPRPPRYLLDWAQAGREAVVFAGWHGSLVCTGESWYRTDFPRMGEAGADGEGVWWRMTLDCPELALAYRGGVRRLAHAVREMVAGRTVVITTVAHGAQGRGSFSDVVFNSLQAGGPVAMQRLRAGLFMPGTIYGIDERSPWFVGLGADLEGAEVKKGLASAEKWERVEAVDEVRRAGEVPAALRERVVGLLKDPEAVVRVHAAVAVLAEHADHAEARGVLVEGLRDESEEVRREAARCVGRVGRGAGFAVSGLVEALSRGRDEDEKVGVVEAIGLVGAEAVGAKGKLIELLDDEGLRVYAAEALGRIGPEAAGAFPKLAGMLGAADGEVQWAAARAMVLIGGEGARPVVPFLVRRLEVAPRGRELYQLTWLLGLLGPVAREALPALAEARERDTELAAMAMWAVAPEEAMPWQLGYTADRPCDLWLFADYIERMGARADGAAVALAEKVVKGRAGRVPSWGYHLLAARVDAAGPVLVRAVKGGSREERGRAVAALGRMGAAGREVMEKVTKDEH